MDECVLLDAMTYTHVPPPLSTSDARPTPTGLPRALGINGLEGTPGQYRTDTGEFVDYKIP